MSADELGLPKSSLQKAIKDMLPAEMRIAGDASDLLVQCCNQFVHLVSTQANVVSEREKRSTISPEHVVRALEELEFGEQYVEAVKAVWDEWKVDNKEHQHQKLVHKKSGLGGSTGLTQQQLIELQHKLFEEARAATLSGPLPSLALDASAVGLGLAGGQAAPPAAAVGAAEQQQQQQQIQQQQAGDQSAAVQADEQQQQRGQAGASNAGGDLAEQHLQQQEQQLAAVAMDAEGGAAEEVDTLDDVDDVDSELVDS